MTASVAAGAVMGSRKNSTIQPADSESMDASAARMAQAARIIARGLARRLTARERDVLMSLAPMAANDDSEADALGASNASKGRSKCLPPASPESNE